MTQKRIFDIILSSIGLIILSPFLGLIVMLIKLDSRGKVIFKQIRMGRFGRPFHIYKFRTMKEQHQRNPILLTASNNHRITRVGRFLRHWKLDELPQLLNVLKGEMSLVGPRPEVPHYVAYYTNQQLKVLDVLPGITDIASLRFIHESEMLATSENPEDFYIKEILPHKLHLNLEYVENSSLRLDMILIIKTIIKIINSILSQKSDLQSDTFINYHSNSSPKVLLNTERKRLKNDKKTNYVQRANSTMTVKRDT